MQGQDEVKFWFAFCKVQQAVSNADHWGTLTFPAMEGYQEIGPVALSWQERGVGFILYFSMYFHNHIHRCITSNENTVFLYFFPQQILTGLFGGAEMPAGEGGNILSVYFFGKGTGSVIGSETGFDMGDGQSLFMGDDRSGQGACRVSLDNNNIRLALIKYAGQLNEKSFHKLIKALTFAHDIQLIVGFYIQAFKLGCQQVRMLACIT